MSTRVEGASPPVILIMAQATVAAGETYLMVTVKEEKAHLWRYNLSMRSGNRVAYGRIIAPDHITALRNAAEICTKGYQPGSIERGLLEAFAHDELDKIPNDKLSRVFEETLLVEQDGRKVSSTETAVKEPRARKRRPTQSENQTGGLT